MTPPASNAAAPAPGVDDARYLAQRRAAWDAILQRHGSSDTGTASEPMGVLPASLLHHQMADSAGDRPISMSELPPPPDFLLDSAGPPEVQLMKTGPPGVAGKVFDGRTVPAAAAAAPLLFEVSDGYRSADSVDDDIDDVDYTIRQPSVHGHLQYV